MLFKKLSLTSTKRQSKEETFTPTSVQRKVRNFRCGNILLEFYIFILKFSEVSATSDIENILQYPAVYEQVHLVSIFMSHPLHLNLYVDKW